MNFKSVMRKTSSIMALIMAFTVMSPIVNIPDTVEAASIRLSKKNVTIKVGQTITLKVKGTKKKVKWSSNKSSVAKVTQKGKVTGKKAGSAKITAKVNNKKLICKITVKSKAKKPVKTNIPVKTKDPLVNVTSMPQNTNVPDESKNPNITQTPIETVKPNNTIVPDTTKIPIKTKNPLINETSTPQNTNAPTTEKPIVTEIPQETIAPNVTEKPEETLAPVETKTPVKLALNFYLEPFNPELPDSQFVEVHFVNHTKEDVYIETDAYMTTKGVNYPAMILYSKEGDLEKVEPVEEDNTDGQLVIYDSKQWVMGNYTPETLWLKSDENSTFTFFFRIGDKRYHATINYDQGGAIFTEASDTDVLQPLVTSTPQETIAPIVTEKPKETLVPVETKTPVKLALNFYLEPFNPELPDSQFVEVHFVNHTKEDVYIETDAYMTTKGVNYPAMILGSKEGDLEKVEPVEENNTYGKRLTYDSKEYVMGNYTHETLWLKSDENSTFTFFFRIGDKRYHATINYDQGGAIFTEASDTEVLEPIMSYTPIKE